MPATALEDRGRPQVGEVMDMGLGSPEGDGAGLARRPSVAALVDDESAARRIESALAAGRIDVAIRAWSDGAPRDGDGEEADVLLAACGSGVTERGERMRRMRRAAPDVCILAVIPEDSRRGVRRALEAGADGVVFEPELETALVPTVRAILAGQTAVPAARRHDVDRPTLSLREKQVLAMVVAGKGNKAIAAELFLAESTVKCHLSSAFSKLGVRSRNEAADLVAESASQAGSATLLPGISEATAVQRATSDGARP
jgi:DNA-binding NarL/FixJ family response regulator